MKWKAANEELRFNGIYVNAMKKPELRLKKNESLPEFAQRVFEDMIAEPEKYFYREKLPVTKGALERFEQFTVNPKLAILQFLVDNPEHPAAQAMMMNKNTDECQKYGGAPCTFIDMCKHGEGMRFQYEVRDKKHNELEGAEISEA